MSPARASSADVLDYLDQLVQAVTLTASEGYELPRSLYDRATFGGPCDRDATAATELEEARQRTRRRRRMYVAVAAFVTLGAAGVFAFLDRTAEAQTDASALAAPSSLSAAPKQRVEITAGGPWGPTSPGRWVLTPIGSGELKPDSGTETSVVRNERHVVRQGQAVKILIWVATAEGKHGSFVLRERIEHMGAGNGFGIGTGTWTLVHGTGAYADATGGGRVSQAESERSRRWSEVRSGFLTIP